MILFVNNYGVEFIPQDTLIKQAMSVIPTCALIQCLKKLSTIGKKCGNQCDDVCDSDERERLCDENPDCCRKLKNKHLRQFHDTITID